MLLFRPDLEDDQLQAAVERVTRAIVNAGGGLSKISPWGKRRLAYPIQHHRDASYFLIHFDIEPMAVRDIERGLLISEDILRHLVVVLEPRQRRAGDADEESPSYDETRAADDTSAPGDTGAPEDMSGREDAEPTEGGDTTQAASESADDHDADDADEDEPAGVATPEEVAG
jgi:small subunit ribosomal protein S6